jgi:hypothetical protein
MSVTEIQTPNASVSRNQIVNIALETPREIRYSLNVTNPDNNCRNIAIFTGFFPILLLLYLSLYLMITKWDVTVVSKYGPGLIITNIIIDIFCLLIILKIIMTDSVVVNKLLKFVGTILYCVTVYTVFIFLKDKQRDIPLLFIIPMIVGIFCIFLSILFFCYFVFLVLMYLCSSGRERVSQLIEITNITNILTSSFSEIEVQ